MKKRWSNWDGQSNSLPALASKIKRCYFCDDSFHRIKPIIQTILGVGGDTTGVYTSKFVSQLFYDIAVPFDTASARRQRKCDYDPKSYGDGKMREHAIAWLLANNKSIDNFRELDDAPVSCWPKRGRKTACSRVLDKLFYA